MTLNEIKKALYKQKPKAIKTAHKDGKHYHYVAQLEDKTIVEFNVPIMELGATPFGDEMESQLLIRWIKQ